MKVTEAVPSNIDEKGATSAVEIAVGGKDQYGKELSIAKLEAKDVTVKATVNGMALKTEEAAFNNGVVTITSAVKLAEGDKLVLTLEHKATDKVTTKSTIEYTVQKAEAKKVTAIELVADETSVASGETITITAKTFDQFNSPAAVDKLRWVVNGKVVADETVKDGVLTLKETTPGDYKVEVFSTEDSKVKQQVTVTFGAAKLTDLTYKNDVKVKDEKVTVTKEDERFNHEELILGTVAPNPGAALSADNVKFHVEPGKDLTKEDIAVTAEEMEDKDGNKVIVVKATTTKPGTFTVTPFVGEEFTGEGVVKAGQFNVTTKVNSEVATISDVTFDAKELKVGKDIYKEIVLKNKHGEVLTAKEADITPKSSNNDITATIEQGKKDIEGQDVNKTYLKVKAEKAGSAAITIQKGDVIKTVNVKFEAAKLAELKVASTKITGVVAGDEETKAKYNALTFLDQDGVKMTAPAKEAVTVKVTNAAGEVVTSESDKELVKLGEMKEVDGKVTFNGTTATHAQILPGSKLDKGTYTVTLSVELEDKKTAEATFQVVVDAAREVTKVDLSTKSDKVVVGGTTDIMITPKDQYGELVKYTNIEAAKAAITVNASNANVTVKELAQVTAGELDSSIKDETEKAKVVGYKVTVTGAIKGSANVDVVVTGADKKEVKASQAITVDTTAALVDKVEIKEVEGVQNASSGNEVQLEAIVKDKNDTVVNVKPEELTWSIKGVKDAKGNALKVEAGTTAGEYTVTLPKEGENAAKTVKLKIDKDGKLTASDSTLGELTVDVTVGVKTQNFKEAETTVTIGTATPEYKEGFKVDKITSGEKEVKFEGDGTEVEINDASKKITFTFTGVDQYGKEIVIDDLNAKGTVATSNEADLEATVANDVDSVATTLTVEAKSLDGGEVYVSYKGTDMVIKVTVAGDAKNALEAQVAAQAELQTLIDSVKVDSTAETVTVGSTVYNQVDSLYSLSKVGKTVVTSDVTKLTDAINTAKDATGDATTLAEAKNTLGAAIQAFEGSAVNVTAATATIRGAGPDTAGKNFDYAAAYEAAGITYENGTITYSKTALEKYLNEAANADAVTQLINGKGVYVGLVYNAPDGADVTELKINGEEATQSFVYDNKYIGYFGVADVVTNEATTTSYESKGTLADNVQTLAWKIGDETVYQILTTKRVDTEVPAAGK